MAQTLEEAGHDLDDHDHEHHENLAHHFDSYEQQFDAGKLGIWIFLVTEVLFFGGLFCAYALYRNLRPEIFAGCSEFLNTQLGAINTGVLLFSSLTMAWAVRCSQTEEHKKLTAMLAATLSCAMIFLGVKAIEYSHKWAMGLLPAGLFTYDPANPHPTGHPNYLFYLCLPFALLFVGVLIWLVVSVVKGNKFQTACAKPLAVVTFCFFVGVGLGMVLEGGGDESHEAEHAVIEAVHGEHEVAHAEPGDHAEAPMAATAVEASPTAEIAAVEAEGAKTQAFQKEMSIEERLASVETNSGLQSELSARERQALLASGTIVVGDAEET